MQGHDKWEENHKRPRKRVLEKMPKAQEKNNLMLNASNTTLAQAHTHTGVAVSQTQKAINAGTAHINTRSKAVVSQRDSEINMDSGDIN